MLGTNFTHFNFFSVTLSVMECTMYSQENYHADQFTKLLETNRGGIIKC